MSTDSCKPHEECISCRPGSHCIEDGQNWPCEVAVMASRLEKTLATLRAVMALHVSERGHCALCSPQEGRAPCTTWLLCEEVLP